MNEEAKDKYLHVEVMGKCWHSDAGISTPYCTCGQVYDFCVGKNPSYHTDYNALNEVVEVMVSKGFSYTFDSLEEGWCQAVFYTSDGSKRLGAFEAPTLAQAIINAIIAAHQGEKV